MTEITEVFCIAQCEVPALDSLLRSFCLVFEVLDADVTIPGSYWGESEAGLLGNRLYGRADTPIHSVLHEASHYICMDSTRRSQLNRDAGGDDQEENAVCYLQILLADLLPDMDRDHMMRDMDAWGYSFRLGSASAWFHRDASDARQWLIDRHVLDNSTQVTGRLRDELAKI